MISSLKHPQWASLSFAASMIASPMAGADAPCAWNTKVGDIVVSARAGPSPANRASMASAAVYDAAVNTVTTHYPAGTLKLRAAPGASVNAPIAAENRTALAKSAAATCEPLVLSVADVPGREVTQNARLFAAVAQAACERQPSRGVLLPPIARFSDRHSIQAWARSR